MRPIDPNLEYLTRQSYAHQADLHPNGDMEAARAAANKLLSRERIRAGGMPVPEFRRLRANLLGISVDGAWCHSAFAKDRKLHFPLLSDFEPKGAVARDYGAYRTQDGFCERALFVLDSEGTIRWSYLSPIGVNPGADGILAALEDLSSKAGR